MHAFVPAQARLQVETPLLDFGAITGDSEYERDIVIRNAGGATLTGTVGSRVPWLTIAQKQFTLGENEMLAIPVKLLPERLESGRYDLADAILLDSDAGQDKIAARVSRRSPVLYVENTIFDLGALHEGDAARADFLCWPTKAMPCSPEQYVLTMIGFMPVLLNLLSAPARQPPSICSLTSRTWTAPTTPIGPY